MLVHFKEGTDKNVPEVGGGEEERRGWREEEEEGGQEVTEQKGREASGK